MANMSVDLTQPTTKYAMRQRWGLFIITIFILMSFWVRPVKAQNNYQFDEFSIKRDYYSTRFDGYYQHYINIEKLDEIREQGASAEKARRKKYQTDYEGYLREYLAERKRQPPVDNRMWQQELIERQKLLEISRKEYAKKNKELKEYIRKNNYIPAEEEFEIDVHYFED
jgi:hypothetical protein